MLGFWPIPARPFRLFHFPTRTISIDLLSIDESFCLRRSWMKGEGEIESDVETPVKDLLPASPTTVRPRKRLRGVSVRMLMLAVLVSGGWLGWICHQSRVQREAVAAIEAAGGGVQYDWQWDSATLQLKPGSSRPGWLRRVLGPGFFEEVAVVVFFDRVADENASRHIGELRQVRPFNLNVTNEGTAHLGAITTLQGLEIDGTEVNDKGVKYLQ
jgi:hypothetical protein